MDRIILASASPRRRELLADITEDFECIVPAAEEVVPEGTELSKAPEYLALLKARTVFADTPNAVVIGSDTGVFIDGEMLGKPKTEEEARAMLTRLGGRTHRVITGCALCFKGGESSFSVTTEVEFYPLTDSQIEAYIKSGEPMDKAGAYGIQGRGKLFVKSINGDYYSVMGLPVAELNRQLEKILNR